MNSPLADIYDPANAAILAGLAAEAYAAPSSAWPAQTVPLDAALTQSQAVVTRTDKDVVVAFRGTIDLRNWLTDLRCHKTALVWSPGKVHGGFLRALDSLVNQLDDLLSATETRRLWITGHSLGGALAMLFALRLTVRRRMAVAGVYTFGQPRVGDLIFSVAYDHVLRPRTFRLVHADDIVPRLPWLFRAYCHAGHEVFYSAVPGTQPVLDPGFWRQVPSGAANLMREGCGGKFALSHDHALSRYLSVLPKLPTQTVPVAQTEVRL